MSISEFVLDSVNVPAEMRDVAKEIVQTAFSNLGISEKELKDPILRKQAGELITRDIMRQTQMPKVDENEEEKHSGGTAIPVPPPPPGQKSIPPPPPLVPGEKITNITSAGPKKDLDPNSKQSTVPPPPPGAKSIPPPPPPPPPVPKISDPAETEHTLKPTPQRETVTKPKEKTMQELIIEQNAKLKKTTVKEKGPVQEEDTLESQLKKLLEERRKALQNKSDDSDDGDEDDDDSDSFD